MRTAARTYYPQWRGTLRRLRRPGPAGGGRPRARRQPVGHGPAAALVPVYRRAWVRQFTRHGGAFAFAQHPPAGTDAAATAYAVRRPPVLVVTVDVFHQRADGSVHEEVVGSQLRWLRRVLDRAAADPAIGFVVVQGHVPVLPPPVPGFRLVAARARARGSQRLLAPAAPRAGRPVPDRRVPRPERPRRGRRRAARPRLAPRPGPSSTTPPSPSRPRTWTCGCSPHACARSAGGGSGRSATSGRSRARWSRASGRSDPSGSPGTGTSPAARRLPDGWSDLPVAGVGAE